MRSQSPARRLARIVLWIGGVALAIFILDLLGIPVREWIEELFDKLGEIPTWAIVAGVVLQSAQTALAALAWFGILVGGVVLLVLLGRIFWPKLAKLRAQVAQGGAVLGQPRRFLLDVVVPSLGSYLARLAIVAVFLGAYGIPASFHNVATVTASNSISNSFSATPGGVGVTQAMNSVALSGATDAATATAYSISQQLVTSAWNVLFAVVLVSWVFGWVGGKALVGSSYADAKVKSRELKEKRRRKDPVA